MKYINFNKTFFLKSIINCCELKYFSGIEIAFLGYSNSGKSTIINCLSNNKKLARVSRSPGCTSTINFFNVLLDFRLVDFPGYGYSKIDNFTQKLLEKNIFFYLQNRKCLKAIVILSDIRFSIKSLDKIILSILKHSLLPILIILTKSDKVSKYNKIKKLLHLRKEISSLNMNITVCSFSKFNKSDIFFIKNQLSTWYFLYKNK
ncbi:ribosome biogenesis GTP-binding protein YihA/YsxC [Buchnera aphidicola]|uniref:Probable GTP-binding protein EngB n=1 Tax=Buchnera aphidicola (Cinara curvipes) TaxID=2518975 RepID=A0A451D6T6_9GAMM|nr:ribosome biogenesis GTP-binding protein YihA/YsxC [Buchnera aphidicola]VFP81559.1 Probable GTP-binding protein EngB [Buchnera aphidicola (Cinara curvipes)]